MIVLLNFRPHKKRKQRKNKLTKGSEASLTSRASQTKRKLVQHLWIQTSVLHEFDKSKLLKKIRTDRIEFLRKYIKNYLITTETYYLIKGSVFVIGRSNRRQISPCFQDKYQKILKTFKGPLKLHLKFVSSKIKLPTFLTEN